MRIRKQNEAERIAQSPLYHHHEITKIEDGGHYLELSLKETSGAYLLQGKLMHQLLGLPKEVIKGKKLAWSKITPPKETYPQTMHAYDQEEIISMPFQSSITVGYSLAGPMTFQEEKGFRKTKGQYGIYPWKDIHKRSCLEEDVKGIIETAMNIPFIYLSGWSQSGTLPQQQAQKEPGYLIFKADEQQASYQDLKSRVESIPKTSIVPRKELLRKGMGLSAFHDEHSTIEHQVLLLEPTSLQGETYQQEFKDRWEALNGIFKDYMNE